MREAKSMIYITIEKEKIKLALEALEQMQARANFDCWNLDICDQAIKAIEEALAQSHSDVKQEQGEPVAFCKVLTMADVADIIVNAQSRTPPYEINYMTVMQLTEKAVLEKFK